MAQWDDEAGQGLAEYALILALIAVFAIIALLFLGGHLSKTLSTVGKSVRATRYPCVGRSGGTGRRGGLKLR